MRQYTGSVPATKRVADWRDLAACKSDPDAMYPGGDGGVEYARSICRRCPVIDTCAQWALGNREQYGVWGGLSANERRAILRRWQRRDLTPAEVAEQAEKVRAPKPAPPTLESIVEASTESRGRHVVWTGQRKVQVDGIIYTPKQAAYMALHGRRANGQVRATCGLTACVRHIADTAERAQCGTRSGYAHHQRTGSAICGPCRTANTDADRRLRNTGTSRVAA